MCFQNFLSSSSVQKNILTCIRRHLYPFLLSFVLSSFNFQNIISNSIRKQRLATLISNVSQQCQLPKHQIKLPQNALLPVLAFNFSQQFRLPKHRFNYVRKHRLAFKASLFLNFSQHFQTTRPSFQKPLKCTNKCPCFQHLISSSKSSFQIASEGSVSHLGVNFFFGSSNFQNIVVVFFKQIPERFRQSWLYTKSLLSYVFSHPKEYCSYLCLLTRKNKM